MSSAQHVLEKLQRVFSVKEAEIDSIIARSEQHFKYGDDLNCGLADFVDNLLGVDVSTLNERAAAYESEHSETSRLKKEMTERLTCAIKDVKSKCKDM
uniref:Uncharacterized protein n=1 Tax=Rhipicephalus zambeziensis TaxID=60191 RepID=A0A224YCU1_9ACAR